MDTPTILLLNDDCLVCIFQYLTLDELMALHGELNPRIDQILEQQLHRFKHFEFSMRFPPSYGWNQLQALGRHLHSLNVNVGYSIKAGEVLDLLPNLCLGAAQSGRLRVLKIQHVVLTGDYIEQILLVAPFLEELDISCSSIEDHLLPNMLHLATNLKTLAVSSEAAAFLDISLLRSLWHLKINWIVGTPLIDCASLSKEYPLLNISVYQSNSVFKFGPNYR
ncbi:uncharacterized protein LOC108607528 [Drosophila busckii]|uniref:uncharacterized protein LOC108607528 n=1 Tax=Drosophila busckii TaxID=30019 RepID=UPI00083EE9EE|nr:uncharacterized protein LOC108607528 [Drosophila busckii]XP_017853896.1 uncharacterized protein LOC108607528 [Drosophila busckii]XP_017853897.1 uncharacterized protein LOC108607528 [Drosophila busckii]XP_017853898.1 uncharacterized protein LOC108607528 [Drosophila busckii]